MSMTILSCLNYKNARTSAKCAMHVPVVDLGEAPPPLFWVKKKKSQKAKKLQSKQNKTTPTPLAQGLDMPLIILQIPDFYPAKKSRECTV